MAAVKGSVIGHLSGKLGLLSARTINGRTIMSARPASFKESTTQRHADIKKRFAVTIAFAAKISELPALLEIWKLNKNPGISATNTIFQKNYNLSSEQVPTLNNIITPDGFGTPVTAAAIAAGKLTGTLAAMDTVAKITSDCKNLSINAVVCLSDPKVESDPVYKILSVSKEVAAFQFTQSYNLEIDFDVEDAAEIAKYNQKTVYLAVAIKSEDDQIVKYSKSYALISA
jgi:hypothetical protein